MTHLQFLDLILILHTLKHLDSSPRLYLQVFQSHVQPSLYRRSRVESLSDFSSLSFIVQSLIVPTLIWMQSLQFSFYYNIINKYYNIITLTLCLIIKTHDYNKHTSITINTHNRGVIDMLHDKVDDPRLQFEVLKYSVRLCHHISSSPYYNQDMHTNYSDITLGYYSKES